MPPSGRWPWSGGMAEAPRSLFLSWPDLGRALSRRPGALFLDFDGTLVPYAERPAAPRLSAGQRSLLSRLACIPGWTVGIISGRGLSDLRRRVGVPGVVYAGNHGLEIEGRDLCFRHAGAVAAREDLAALRRATARALVAIPGARVEDKGLTWAAHFRGVRAAQRPGLLRTFWRSLRPAALADRVRVHPGAMIREVLPPVAWDKGSAVRWILARTSRQPRPVVIYIGDDIGDESAFAAIGREGISVLVGRRKRSRARFLLRDPCEVERFLRLLAQATVHSNPSASGVGRG